MRLGNLIPVHKRVASRLFPLSPLVERYADRNVAIEPESNALSASSNQRLELFLSAGPLASSAFFTDSSRRAE